ncbi:hypothetical protein ACGFI9_25850 [Micromonospora sp. NPDC048930]|uniref:hypothetical protein n=1 Tax=Micromonospora sp. NPDC048930 TaxID=3364261 RepID=UPI00371732CF
MATIAFDNDRIRVRLTPAEKLWALRGDLSFPRDAVRAVTVEPDGLHATRGMRAPGLGVPGRRKVGTWGPVPAASCVPVSTTTSTTRRRRSRRSARRPRWTPGSCSSSGTARGR